MSEEAHPTGSVVLVPFPFTDLSGRKRRPALVISLEGFDDEDLVLCAITSRLPERFSEWGASLGVEDMVEERLPKRSVVKVGKLFTMHRSLIARRFGTVREHELEEILSKLRTFFARPAWIYEPDSEDREAGLKAKEIDEAVLGLLYLNVFEHHGQSVRGRLSTGTRWTVSTNSASSATPRARPSPCHSPPRASPWPKSPSESDSLYSR